MMLCCCFYELTSMNCTTPRNPSCCIKQCFGDRCVEMNVGHILGGSRGSACAILSPQSPITEYLVCLRTIHRCLDFAHRHTAVVIGKVVPSPRLPLPQLLLSGLLSIFCNLIFNLGPSLWHCLLSI